MKWNSFAGLILMLFVTICSCKQESEKKDTPEQPKHSAPNPYQDAVLSVSVFKVDSIEHSGQTGWGYDILVNGTIHIHQPNIPSVMGNNGFSSAEYARKAGEFVIHKMRNNILPPFVTPDELDSLGVLN